MIPAKKTHVATICVSPPSAASGVCVKAATLVTDASKLQTSAWTTSAARGPRASLIRQAVTAVCALSMSLACCVKKAQVSYKIISNEQYP